MTQRIHILLLLLIVAISPALAADINKEVADALKAKNYDKAITDLQSEMARGSSTELYYDLGNVYYAAGNYGAAVLNYERALRLDPHNSQAKNNLAYTQNEVVKLNEALRGDRNIDPYPAAPSALHALKLFVITPGSDFWCVVSIALFLLAVISFAVYLLVQPVKVRKITFFGSGILVILAAVSLCFSFVSRSAMLSKDEVVIMAAQVNLKSAPGAKGKDVAAPIVSGTVLKLIGQPKKTDGAEWINVSLNGDYTGWLQLSDAEIITVPELK